MESSYGTKEDYIDYDKFSAEIDLGFDVYTDRREDIIRKKKEDEAARKIQREQADFYRMMKRKKLDI
jgi:hypothetical protein